MSGREKLLVFALSGLPCALRLEDVERVLPAVEISPVPKAPGIILGLINVHGRILPVLNIRPLLCLPEIETGLNNQIILTLTEGCSLAILVDEVLGLAEFSEQDIIGPEELYPGIEYLEGVTKVKDGMLYIYNLGRFLSSEERSEIEHLLSWDRAMPAGQEA
jgi:purine-binding chemotaxis protein CheW